MAARRLALLGGTTTLADCLVAIRYAGVGRRLIHGPAISAYEQAFARRIGVRHAYSFSTGRVGLYGLLRALRVQPGDEVLLQVPTHIVVANAIRFAGCRPVYVDCRLDSFNMDLELAERRITPRTRVLLLQHTFGVPADLDRALALATRHRLQVIEDCVHSLGATYGGKPVGSFGSAAFFSTEETKTISTTMGGMVVTDDSELADRLALFQAGCIWPSGWLIRRYLLKLVLYHFLTQPNVHRYARAIYESLGERHPLPRPTTAEEQRGVRPANYEQRLSNAQADLGLRQLRRLDANLGHRRSIANALDAWLSKHGLDTPQTPAGSVPALLRYPLWVDDRAAAIQAVRQQVVLGTWFTSVLEEAVSPAYGDYEMGSCPRAELAARHLINLPTHLRVHPGDVETIASTLASRAGLRASPGSRHSSAG
jgi:perosamine synthetase